MDAKSDRTARKIWTGKTDWTFKFRGLVANWLRARRDTLQSLHFEIMQNKCKDQERKDQERKDLKHDMVSFQLAGLHESLKTCPPQ